MNFWKMNGAGNDFLILDGIREKINTADVPHFASTLCERHMSIGADGLMLVLPAEAEGADYRMLFYNSDGSMGEMCGNGARCICRYGYETGLAGAVQRVETTAGLVTGQRIDSKNYRIRLNDPTVCRTGGEVTVDGQTYECAYVELGTPGLPHAVVELPESYRGAVSRLLRASAEVGQEDRERLAELRELGRRLRYYKEFPKGANVNFYAVTGTDTADIITFERGVEDFTYACGTGTGSTALVLAEKKLVGKGAVAIRNRGGMLSVDIRPEGLFLTGPTNIVAKGVVTDESL